MHANSGVEKGMAAGGKPVEIMGMMLGRPDTETPNALIVTDVSVCAILHAACFHHKIHQHLHLSGFDSVEEQLAFCRMMTSGFVVLRVCEVPMFGWRNCC